MGVRKKLVRVGNSVGIIIPKALVDALGLREGDEVELTVTGQGILIKLR